MVFLQALVRLGLLLVLAVQPLAPKELYAQSAEDRFHDLFLTAGYATAFGAALGAAALSFTQQPEDHLKFVAMGASLGFIGGSAMGTYMVVSPLLGETQHKHDKLMPPSDRSPGSRSLASNFSSLGFKAHITIMQF